MSGIGPYLVGVAFWIFIGAVSVAAIVTDYKRRRGGVDVLFGAWLRKLAVNCWLQHARLKKREVELDEEVLLDMPGSATTAERLDLDAALARLPPGVRLCVVLAYSEGMSHAEISAATAMPLGTVKSHVNRGAARLRELLHAYGETHA